MSGEPGEDGKTPIILDNPTQGYRYSLSKGLRERLKQRLGSTKWQWTIIALVICDAILVRLLRPVVTTSVVHVSAVLSSLTRSLAQVGTDIILSSVYCGYDHPPHAVEDAEEWLRILSIIILSFFVLEWLLEVRAVLSRVIVQILFLHVGLEGLR